MFKLPSSQPGMMNGSASEFGAQAFAPPPEIVSMISDTTKLQKRLLQMDIELRQHQIREARARTAYFIAATKFLNEKRTQPRQSDQSDAIVVDPSVLLE